MKAAKAANLEKKRAEKVDRESNFGIEFEAQLKRVEMQIESSKLPVKQIKVSSAKPSDLTGL